MSKHSKSIQSAKKRAARYPTTPEDITLAYNAVATTLDSCMHGMAEIFRDHREELCLTQEEFAAELQCSIKTIERIEGARQLPSRGLVHRLTKLIGDELYRRECESGDRPSDVTGWDSDGPKD